MNFDTQKHAGARMHIQSSYIPLRLEDMVIYYSI